MPGEMALLAWLVASGGRMVAAFALAMAGAAAAHESAAAARQGNGPERARASRASGDPQRGLRGPTAAAADAPAALQTLSRLQQLASASPQVAQLRRLQALAAGRSAPVAQLASGPEEEELVQGKFATAQPQPQLQQAPRANNTGLPDQLKSGIESLSGFSMDHVRVHYNSAQPAQLNALAYAQGSDIHLAPGQERHLPHEAWHVVQQAQGRVRPTLQMKDGVQVNDDVGLEREADVMGGRATQINGIRHLCPDSALPSNLAIRKNSSILLQRKIYINKDNEGRPIPISSLESFKNTETTECMAFLKALFDDQTKDYYFKDALEIARKQSIPNQMAVPSVVATNSAAAPLASAVPPPSIPDEKPHKPIVIAIKGPSAHGDNKNQKQSKAVKVKAPTLDEQVKAIIDDMKRQFEAWKSLGAKWQNRGAWWGSQSPGDTKGAKAIPQNLIVKLKDIAEKHGWRFTNSFSSDLSFHKTFHKIDFIYHLRPPHEGTSKIAKWT